MGDRHDSVAPDERAAARALDRIARLHRATDALSDGESPDLVASAVIREAVDALEARGGIVLVVDGTALRQVSVLGLGDTPPIARDAELPVAVSLREERAFFFESRDQLLEQFPALTGYKVDSSLGASVILPLVLKGRPLGVIGLYFGAERTFSEEARAFAGLVARHCALALDRVTLATAERRTSERNALLARAGEILSSSLDMDRVLEEFAKLTVPRLADWCAIELVAGDTTRQVTVAHVDPNKVRFAWEVRERFPPDRNQPAGVHHVIKTGVAELYPDIPDEMLVASAQSEEHLAISRALGIRSALCVPLVAREAVIGAITMVWAESGHRYSEGDLDLVKDLGRRAGLALDNARLYAEVATAVSLRDEFLSVAGHELNTPLAALLLQLQSLQRLAEVEKASPKLSERVAKALRAVVRLEALVEDLLDVSRITTGRLQLDPEPLDLGELIDEVGSRLSEVAVAASSAMTVTAPRGITGTFDRARLDQVISNLLSNAIKYGEAKPVTVELTKDGDHAVVRVEDHGIGIAKEQQQLVFERFERAVAARDFSGFGLGLWISRQIVEASGGTITVESELGQGSRFTLRLPLNAHSSLNAQGPRS